MPSRMVNGAPARTTSVLESQFGRQGSEDPLTFPFSLLALRLFHSYGGPEYYYLLVTCLLPACYLLVTCLLPACYLLVTCLLPACYPTCTLNSVQSTYGVPTDFRIFLILFDLLLSTPNHLTGCPILR